MHLFLGGFQSTEIKVLDYKSFRLALYEYLKRFKFIQGIPLFYWKRSQIWRHALKQTLDLDRNFPHFTSDKKIQRYLSERFDALVVGMDVWCIIKGTERPLFPNIYWLPEKMDVLKIAYGVSAYNSDPRLIQNHKHEIIKYLNDFDIIGSRDRFTIDMVNQHRTRASGLVDLIPDPTFMYEINPTGVRGKLSRLGIDFNRPILGLLLFGRDEISRAISSHYKSKGYQIVALSMYNRFADINLGHVLNPFEWAEVFRFFSFCITDRFHGTIFCLRNQTPFIGFEKDTHLPKIQSKIYNLLSDFDLTECYVNPSEEGFSIARSLHVAGEIESNWTKSFKPLIPSKIIAAQDRHRDFLQRMKYHLSG